MNMNKDLQYERSRCTFDPVEVTYLFDGSPEKTKRRRDQGIRSLNYHLFSLTPIIKHDKVISFFFAIIKN